MARTERRKHKKVCRKKREAKGGKKRVEKTFKSIEKSKQTLEQQVSR